MNVCEDLAQADMWSKIFHDTSAVIKNHKYRMIYVIERTGHKIQIPHNLVGKLGGPEKIIADYFTIFFRSNELGCCVQELYVDSFSIEGNVLQEQIIALFDMISQKLDEGD